MSNWPVTIRRPASVSCVSGIILVIASLSVSPACRLPGDRCDSADPTCDATALWLYNAPCHARSWSTFYGAPDAGVAAAEAAVQALDSGYVLAGRARQSFGTPLLSIATPGNRNIFVAKFDEDGALLWNTFLGESTDRPLSMIATGDGYLVTGTATLSFGSPLLAFSAGNDGIIAKLDLNGNLLWHTYIGTAGADELTDAVADGFGAYIVSGSSSANIPNAGQVVVGHTNPGTDQFFVMKIDGFGTPQWQSHIGGAGAEKAQSVKAIAGGFVLSGSSDAAFNAAFNNQRNAHSTGSTDYAAVAINGDGAYLWHTFHGAAGDSDDFSFQQILSDGRIFLGGVSMNTWGTPVAAHPDPGVQGALTFLVLDVQGDLTWNAFYGNAGGSGSTPIGGSQRLNGDLVFLGGATASFGAPITPYQGGSDFVVGALDPNSGSLLRHGFYGGTGNESAAPQGFLQACDNGFLITGASNASFGAPLVPYSGTGFKGYILKLAPEESP